MQQKEKRPQKLILVLAGLAAILLLVFVIWSVRLYQKKQADAELVAQWQNRENGVEASKTDTEESSYGTVKNEITYEGETYKRKTYVKAILCMGVDRDEELSESTQAGSGGQSDGIFVLAWDTQHDTMKVLAIPRDTMTAITLRDLSGNVLGQDIQHLTLAYAYGDGKELSCRYMSEAVTELLGGLEINGYAALSMKALGILNDAVGGVTVTIDDEGMVSKDTAFAMGSTITLQGDQAEAYIRYRDITKANTALSRLDRQKDYMEKYAAAFRRTAMEKEGFLSDLYSGITPYLVTDLSKDQLLEMGMAFAKNGQTFADEDILTLPGEGVETDLYDEYHYDPEETTKTVLSLFYGLEK